MNLINRLFPKKEKDNLPISDVTRRFDFGQIFMNNKITYRYLYTQYGKDVLFKDTEKNACIVLFKSEDITL